MRFGVARSCGKGGIHHGEPASIGLLKWENVQRNGLQTGSHYFRTCQAEGELWFPIQMPCICGQSCMLGLSIATLNARLLVVTRTAAFGKRIVVRLQLVSLLG